MNIVSHINRFLEPVNTLLMQYRRYIGYILIVLAIASLYYLTDITSIKESGEKAITVLWIILWIPIFSRVFGIRLFQTLLPLRRELGILMGVLAVVHGTTYIMPYPETLGTREFWFTADGYPSYLAFGYVAMLLSIPLTLTSSVWIMKKMGKYWKLLHRIVYVILIFSVVHVVLLQAARHLEIGPLVFLGLYFIGKGLEWYGFSFAPRDTNQSYPKGQKWLCVPCGYIYDPLVGDEESGVAPGTEFTDIPEDWRCPDCGVTKSDFIPLVEGEEVKTYSGKIIQKTFLNPTTLELMIETDDDHEARPGQYMSFAWQDEVGSFVRSYSIVKQEGKIFVFTIKLTEHGRGAKLLRNIPENTTIQLRGVFGSFILQDTPAPKIYIATGTGLAPIYNMITHLDPAVVKSLYFSVATESELFYIDLLRAIPNLDLHIHVTRETGEGYHAGRIDISSIQADPDTEWYLCGNPSMIRDARAILETRGFMRVYSEEFN